MPTYYYIITNDLVRSMVDNNYLNKLSDYVDRDISENVLSSNENEPDMTNSRICRNPYIELTNCPHEKIYHILSYATDVSNLKVLKFFEDVIDTTYVPDGNAYNLFRLAIENYTNDYPTNIKKRYDTIIFLFESQLKNHGSTNIHYYMNTLINFCDKTDNYDLVTSLVRTYKVSIDSLYFSTIQWNYPKVFDKLIDDFYDVIDLSCMEEAINMAYRCDNNSIVSHVMQKISLVNPEVYETIKHLVRSNEYLLEEFNDTAPDIPDNVTRIKTSYAFNQSVDNIKWPSGLQLIEFGACFNQSLNNVIFPDTVVHMSFGIHYNWSSFKQSLKTINFPKSLQQYINQGAGCNENIDDVVFPDSLETLSIGFEFNSPIDNVKWPTSLEMIIFGNDFDQSLENVKFPISLHTINFNQTESSLSMSTITHPITTLRLSNIKNYVTKLVPSLKRIICSKNDKKYLPALPDGCVVDT